MLNNTPKPHELFTMIIPQTNSSIPQKQKCTEESIANSLRRLKTDF